MATIVSEFIPHVKQLEVIQDPHRFKVIACGRRFGKTMMAINYLIYCALRYGGNYWYVAPTFQQAKLIAWEMLKKYSPEAAIAKKNETELWIRYITGGSIRLFGTENEDALRGVGLHGIILDEFADMKSHVWPTIIRPMLTEHKGWAWFLGTPKGFQVFYEHFIRCKHYNNPEYRDIEGRHISPDPDYKSWQFKSIDSPFIDPEEVEKARQELSDEYFRQEYEASFENYTGLIYKEFKQEHIKKFDVQNNWAVYVGIDTGKFTAITFIGLNYSDEAYIFDELYLVDEIVENAVKEIKRKLQGYNLNIGDVQFIIDSASQVKREFAAHGIMTYDSEKDVLNSIDIIRGRFKNGKLYMHEICVTTISQFRGYQWEDKLFGRSKLPKPKKENDHFNDAVAYVLGSSFVRNPKEVRRQITLKDIRDKKVDIMSKDFEVAEDELGIMWKGENPYINNNIDKPGYDYVTSY